MSLVDRGKRFVGDRFQKAGDFVWQKTYGPRLVAKSVVAVGLPILALSHPGVAMIVGLVYELPRVVTTLRRTRGEFGPGALATLKATVPPVVMGLSPAGGAILFSASMAHDAWHDAKVTDHGRNPSGRRGRH